MADEMVTVTVSRQELRDRIEDLLLEASRDDDPTSYAFEHIAELLASLPTTPSIEAAAEQAAHLRAAMADLIWETPENHDICPGSSGCPYAKIREAAEWLESLTPPAPLGATS